MSEDFYCDEALSGRTPVDVVLETDDVLAFHHTRPFWPVHIVVIPKRHVPSLIDLGGADEALLHKVLAVVRQVAAQVTREHGACRVLTNLGRYQDSKHLHFHVNSGEPRHSAPEARRPRPDETTEEHDHPLRHFQLMVQLAEALRVLPAQMLAHEYRHDAFGSWWTTLKWHGKAFRIVFDGKERQLRLERASTTGNAGTWEELSSWPTNDPDAARGLTDVVARLRAV